MIERSLSRRYNKEEMSVAAEHEEWPVLDTLDTVNFNPRVLIVAVAFMWNT
jgi:hypothetical protein